MASGSKVEGGETTQTLTAELTLKFATFIVVVVVVVVVIAATASLFPFSPKI